MSVAKNVCFVIPYAYLVTFNIVCHKLFEYEVKPFFVIRSNMSLNMPVIIKFLTQRVKALL